MEIYCMLEGKPIGRENQNNNELRHNSGWVKGMGGWNMGGDNYIIMGFF
jgi:hypothetical protein